MTDNQVVYTMFDIKTSIHMDRFVPHRDWEEDPRLIVHSDIYFTQDAKGDHLSILIYILSHRSTLYWSMAMFYHLESPLCIYRGYDQFMSWRYRSTLYLRWLYPSLVSSWIHSIFIGGHTLSSLLLKHRYACLGFETHDNICLMVVCSFYQVF